MAFPTSQKPLSSESICLSKSPIAWYRLWRPALFFIAGFAITDVAIHVFVGDPFSLYAEYRSEKLALLAAPGFVRCSAAFGTSHVHNGFDPRAFDSAMLESGTQVNSFNLGIEGGSQGEQFRMAERFLAVASYNSRKIDRCLLMLEVNAGLNMQEKNFLHPRAINTYDGEVAVLSSEFLSPTFGWHRNLGRLSVIAAGTALFYGNTGMLASRLFPHDLDRTLMHRQTIDDRRGLLAEPPVAKESAEVEQLIANRALEPALQPAVLTRGHLDVVARLMRSSGAMKMAFIYVVTPKLSDLTLTETYPKCLNVGGNPVPIVNVAQPVLYPQLYRSELWHDAAHLNEAGAMVFSRMLAGQISTISPAPSTNLGCASF
jgi:hypothetical protein